MAASEPDHQLWRRLGTGDQAALGALFDRHSRAVYNFAFRRTASWSSAEDITQSTFTTLWRRAAGRNLPADLQHESALPWLLGVADKESRNVVRGHGRRDRLQRRILAIEAPVDEQDPADDVAGRLDDERRMAALRTAMGRLSEPERLALELVTWAGLSMSEAATTLGIPPGTVKSRLFRARTKLVALLNPTQNGGPR